MKEDSFRYLFAEELLCFQPSLPAHIVSFNPDEASDSDVEVDSEEEKILERERAIKSLTTFDFASGDSDSDSDSDVWHPHTLLEHDLPRLSFSFSSPTSRLLSVTLILRVKKVQEKTQDLYTLP